MMMYWSELARVYVRKALERWVPEVDVVGVEAMRDGAELRIRVRFRDAAGSGQQECSLPQASHWKGNSAFS